MAEVESEVLQRGRPALTVHSGQAWVRMIFCTEQRMASSGGSGNSNGSGFSQCSRCINILMLHCKKKSFVLFFFLRGKGVRKRINSGLTMLCMWGLGKSGGDA